MNLELDAQATRSLRPARKAAVGAGLFLFLLHRLGLDPAEDIFAWLLVVLPALELSAVLWLAALVVDGEVEGDRWTVVLGGLRWFGLTLAANWALALFVAATLEAYVRLGAPTSYIVPI